VQTRVEMAACPYLADPERLQRLDLTILDI
jgi:hypothetical protein